MRQTSHGVAGQTLSQLAFSRALKSKAPLYTIICPFICKGLDLIQAQCQIPPFIPWAEHYRRGGVDSVKDASCARAGEAGAPHP
jgi:hypothetical protein